MDLNLVLVVVVIVIALGFDFTNGFHDAANAIATSVSTRALTPRVALLMAAENPERVGRMVLTGCAGLLPKRSGGAQVKQAVFGALKAGYESRAVQKLLGKNAEKQEGERKA